MFCAGSSHRDSDSKNCSRCTAGCCAPVTGSAPASAVSVLFRSRGASKPARYSRNPCRCAKEPNRSSNRAAHPSKGPGAAGQARLQAGAVKSARTLGVVLGAHYDTGAFVADGSTPPATANPVTDYQRHATPSSAANVTSAS